MKQKIIKIILIILVLCFLKACFFFTGPIYGTILDAKTNRPLYGIEVNQKIYGSSFSGNVGGGGFWSYEKTARTDENGKFYFSQPISFKLPFLSLVNERELSINKNSQNNLGEIITYPSFYEKGYKGVKVATQGYDGFEYDISWLPFKNYNFKLLPLNSELNLEYCKDLDDDDKLRCLYQASKFNSQDELAVAQLLIDNEPTSKEARLLFDYADFLFDKYKNHFFQCCEKKQQKNLISELFADFLPTDPCSNQGKCNIIKASEKNDLSLCSTQFSNVFEDEEDKNQYINNCQFTVAMEKQSSSSCEAIKKTPSKNSEDLSKACLYVLDKLEPVGKKVSPLNDRVDNLKICEQYKDALFYKCVQNYLRRSEPACRRHLSNIIMAKYKKPYTEKYAIGAYNVTSDLLYATDSSCNRYLEGVMSEAEIEAIIESSLSSSQTSFSTTVSVPAPMSNSVSY